MKTNKVSPQAQVSGPATQAKDEIPTTGIPQLDRLLAEASLPDIATAYACLQLSWANSELGDLIQAALEHQIERLRAGTVRAEIESEILPAKEWLSFCDGFRARHERDEESQKPCLLNDLLPTRGKAREDFQKVAVEKVKSAMLGFDWSSRKEILQTVLSKVEEILCKARQLAELEDLTRAFYDKLPAKTKAIIGVLVQAASVQRAFAEITYAHDILYRDFAGRQYIDQALGESPNNPEIVFLAEIYDLSSYLINAA